VEVIHDQGGEQGLDEAEEEKMLQDHGGDRHGQWIGRVQGPAITCRVEPGWRPNMRAVVKEAAVRPNQPPIPAEIACPLREGRSRTAPVYGIAREGHDEGDVQAIGSDRRDPPSPNRRAWMTRAILMASAAPQGPTATAIRTPPTAWPVVAPEADVEHHH